MKIKDPKPITITGVPETLRKEIEALKERSGVTMSSYVKTILREHVEKFKVQKQ